MTAPIFDEVERILGSIGLELTNTGHVETWLTSHMRHNGYHSPQQHTTPAGAAVSLSSIAATIETALGDLKNIATAADNDPLVQAALNVDPAVGNDVRQAGADLVPLLTGLHPSLVGQAADAIKNVISAFRAIPIP